MFFDMFKNLSERNEGLILIISGGLLFFHTIGIIQLNLVLSLVSVSMLVGGFIKVQGPQYVKSLLSKRNNNY